MNLYITLRKARPFIFQLRNIHSYNIDAATIFPSTNIFGAILLGRFA